MFRRSVFASLLFAMSALVSVLQAAPPSENEMAARIDELLGASWKENGIKPAPPASDAEFLRRAWLDLCGIIPSINDSDGISGIHSFLDDPSPDKRERLV
jgi:hypothetical protein